MIRLLSKLSSDHHYHFFTTVQGHLHAVSFSSLADIALGWIPTALANAIMHWVLHSNTNTSTNTNTLADIAPGWIPTALDNVALMLCSTFGYHTNTNTQIQIQMQMFLLGKYCTGMDPHCTG